jgi:Salmonella virulence plasmid 65kDa B protein
VNVPNHQQVEGYTPTTISGLKAADPGAKVNLIEPPQVNSTGAAKLSYPIELPPGRNGHQPSLAIGYDSSRGNGWLGTGWGLDVPSIDIDTRWGVPRYDTGLETETYMLNGAQLAPVANRGDLLPRRTTPANQGDCQAPCTTFSLRVEGEFLKIVRHGGSPSTYWWEVTAKDGTRSLFGGSPATGTVDPQAVLADPTTGNIGRWVLREVIDTNGNNIRFYYDVVPVNVTQPQFGPEPARQIYPLRIFYTGRAGVSGGPYEVCFTRDNNGGPGQDPTRRSDPIVDGRLGFKTVMADRLVRVDVMLAPSPSPTPTSSLQAASICASDRNLPSTQPIRSYTLNYKPDPANPNATGQFNKSLLRSIAQLGTDGITTFNQHSFTYFDEIGNGNDAVPNGGGSFDPTSPGTITAFGAPGSGNVPGGAGLTSGSSLVGDVNGTAFSGEGNSSGQTHLYTSTPALPSAPTRSCPSASRSAPTPTTPICPRSCLTSTATASSIKSS